jgi:hypothetical protein
LLAASGQMPMLRCTLLARMVFGALEHRQVITGSAVGIV